MEVHHHSHHPKKWKEYISEFLMLFLAVSLGFLAENLREEQIIEHQTESVLGQLRMELMEDTAQLSNNKITIAKLDTAVALVAYIFKNDQLETKTEEFYLLHNYILYRIGIFESSCIALDQLKYTGLMKNIKDENLRSAIEKYNLSLKNLEARAERETNFMDNNTDDLIAMPFDVYKPYNTNIDYLNTEEGRNVKEADVFCNNTKFHFNTIQTFVPNKIVLKKFDKQAYLNILFKLNGIRNSTQGVISGLAYTRVVDLIKSIESAYPDIKSNSH